MVAPTQTANPSPTLSATTSEPVEIHRCEMWPDGEHQCQGRATQQSPRNGRWMCGSHWRNHVEALKDTAERAVLRRAKMDAPLPSLEDAVAQLAKSGKEYGIGLPEDWQPVDARTLDGGLFCGTCWGQHWLRVPVGPETGWTSQLQRCPACADWRKAERLNRLAEIAGLTEQQRRKTFATFKADRASTQAVQAAAQWARQPDGWLVVYGEVGSGKTHLQLAAANRLVEQEMPFRWWFAADVVTTAKALIDAGSLHHQFLADLKREQILLLDDLGTVRPTDWVLSDFLEPLFEHRYRNRMATFVTCIADPEAVKLRFSESIGRRLQDRTVCTAVKNDAPQWGQ